MSGGTEEKHKIWKNVPTEIRTEHLPNTYRYTSLLCSPLLLTRLLFPHEEILTDLHVFITPAYGKVVFVRYISVYAYVDRMPDGCFASAYTVG
jgi:hypothetical protein